MFFPRIQSLLYRHLFKQIAFRFDAEMVHDDVTRVGQWLGRHRLLRSMTHTLWSYKHPSLEQTLLGIHFPNPVGLTAGFDKDGYLTDILPDIGFGFAELGSITGQPCEGNPKPRLWRLPKSESLVVYYGLKNEGSAAVSARLRTKTFRIPIGISIAKTNSLETCHTERAIEDYVMAMQAFINIGDYLTINISCPNAYGGEAFTLPHLLQKLLDKIDLVQTAHPIFLKMPADLSFTDLDKLVEVAKQHRVHGFILTNLTKKRDRREIDLMEVAPHLKGGLSGKPLFEVSNAAIGHLYKTVGDRFVIVGTGGIFSAKDAYEKIRQGASLVQLATGMIFQGPQLIGQINRDLVSFLRRDGFANIHEAIGAYHR